MPEDKSPTKPNDDNKDEKKPKFSDEPPVTTQHELKTPNLRIKYTANVGMLPLKNDDDEIEAQIFFTAYTASGVKDFSERPLTFVFNGGPGSSSVWLHLGAIGPMRVQMQDEGWMPPPPYKRGPNDQTWLDQTDLVFLDPVGTGYSRALNDELNKKYWSLQGDLDSMAEAIRLYLTRFERWSSPLFLAGESYGTTRAAGLSKTLFDKGIALNGIVLISTILNFQTARFTPGNDLPFALFLPTYTATAWYHDKLPQEYLSRPVEDVLQEVEDWVENTYIQALSKGDQLSDEERATIMAQLARYTGLETRYIDGANLRVQIMRFCKELMRDGKRTVGRLDSRFVGEEPYAVTEFFEFDPSLTAITPPYTASFNDYMRRGLRYETDREYEILSFKVNQSWEFDRGQFPDTGDMLRATFARNRYMKVLVTQGYYDLATPYYAARYTMNHLGLDPALHDNIQYAYYEAGHMFYLDVTSLAKLKKDVSAFYQSALGN